MGTITQTLGRVRVTPRGAWNSNETYRELDIVNYTNNNAYICIKAGTGKVPTNTEYWQLLVCGSAHTPYLDSNGVLRWDLLNGS